MLARASGPTAAAAAAATVGVARALGSAKDVHAPRAQCDRYTDDTYSRMRDDGVRTAAYRSAIERYAPGRVVCDIGTGALALLAVMAARAGAEHVYAIEANTEAAAAARLTVADEGLSERITVLEGYSTDATLPRPADLLLHEILGEIASAEGVVAAVRDAGQRYLRLGGGDGGPVSIPARARTLLAPCEFPGTDYFDALPHPMLAAPGAQVLKLPALPRKLLLAPAAPFEELRFEAATPDAAHTHELRFRAQRAGELRGLALHLEVFVAEGAARPEVSSADEGSHWANVLVLLEPTAVAQGAQLLVRTDAQLGGPAPSYSFEAWLGGEGEDDEPPEAMRWLGKVRYP